MGGAVRHTCVQKAEDSHMTSNILVEKRDGIATVTFNRPEQRNVIDYEGWLELRKTALDLGGDDFVRVVVIMGKGDEAFSAGADIKDFAKHRGDSKVAARYAEAFDGALDAIEALPMPTVCCIKGFCVGGGCELAMAADIRIAADNGRFGIPVARLGILVGYHEMRRLIDLVGPGNANYLLLSGRIIDTQEALRIGLVHSVVSLSDVEDQVYELAREISHLAPLSHQRHKQILQTVLRNPSLGRLTSEEERLPFANFDSEDFDEGRRAFIERGEPRFKGR